jgi:hypothetical protein
MAIVKHSMKPFDSCFVNGAARRDIMIIIMLAATMTLAMLIATAFSLHQEAQRVRIESRQKKISRYRY